MSHIDRAITLSRSHHLPTYAIQITGFREHVTEHITALRAVFGPRSDYMEHQADQYTRGTHGLMYRPHHFIKAIHDDIIRHGRVPFDIEVLLCIPIKPYGLAHAGPSPIPITYLNAIRHKRPKQVSYPDIDALMAHITP